MKEVPNPKAEPAEQLRETLQQIVDLSEDEFTGLMRYGKQLAFTDQIPLLTEMRYFARRILALDLKSIPGDYVGEWLVALKPVYEQLRRIATGDTKMLSSDSSDLVRAKRNWVEAIESVWRTFLNNHAGKIALVLEAQRTEKGDEAANLVTSTNKTITDFSKASEGLVKTFTEEIKTRQEAFDKALQAVSSASKKTAVTAQAKHFGDLVFVYTWSAILWGIFLLAMAVGAVVYVLYFVEPSLNDLPAAATRTAIVSHTLPRVLIFSAIYFVMVWAGKNMTAAMHNVVINKHRVAGLKTLEAFQGATEADKPTRLAVLLQVTTSIFSHHVSGYVKEEATTQDHAMIDSITRLVSAADGKPQPPTHS